MKNIILSLVLSISCISMAQAGAMLNTNVITRVGFYSGGFYIFANNWNNANNCDNASAVVLKTTDTNYDKAYALLLTAYTTGKSVKGFSDECISHDGVTYNTIRGYKYLDVQ